MRGLKAPRAVRRVRNSFGKENTMTTGGASRRCGWHCHSRPSKRSTSSAQDRQKGFQFGAGFREEVWRNRLIWGDKKYVLPSLLPEFAGKVNLIYIDPPFDTGADFSFTATVPDDPESEEDDSFTFTKEPSVIEHKAYRDTWGRGLNSYLQWFYESATLLHELLHESGSIYVHLDWHVGYPTRSAACADTGGISTHTSGIATPPSSSAKCLRRGVPSSFCGQ